VVGFSKIIGRRLDELVFPAVTSDDPKIQRAMRQVGENLDIISTEGERLTAMINDVLDLAKIESGRMEWRRVPVQIEEIMLRASAATSSLISHAGLTLVTDVEPELPTVIGDRDRLIQVVINLISNAVKFTPSGTVTGSARRDGDHVVVSIADTGVGIAPEDQERVFEQFRQAGDTLTDKPRGTGLGLPICREIVEHHGGRIWVESRVGVGSTFSFTLPVPAAETSRADAGEPIAAGVGRNGSEVADGTRRVLVVEDDAGTRELVRQALEANGYLVEVAPDGKKALEAVAANPPALVILDVMLPVLDGFSVVERMKAELPNGGPPVVMLTIVDEPERAARLGVESYLHKPFDTDELLRRVRRLAGATATL
jgi:CheY-like chemotaxis protein